MEGICFTNTAKATRFPAKKWPFGARSSKNARIFYEVSNVNLKYIDFYNTKIMSY
jgi:hypothetical protein